MSPRLASLIVFVVVFGGLQLWGSRRDRPARAPFEMDPPVGFQSFDRADAAAYATNFDEAATEKMTGPGGKVFFHFRGDDEPEGPPIVVETEESPYPLRTQPSDAAAMFAPPGLTKSGVFLKLLGSRVTKLGPNEIIVAEYEADVGGKPVLLTTYAVPIDKGTALVSAFCPRGEEGKYRPLYDRMIEGAKGVAYRPERIPWWLASLLAAGVAAVAHALVKRFSGARREAPVAT